MVQRYYTFDSTARRQLTGKGLIEHYQQGEVREYYLDVARDVWDLLRQGTDSPLPADAFQMLAEVLKRNDRFTQELLDHHVDVDRSFLKWPGYFAAMIIHEDWDDITAER